MERKLFVLAIVGFITLMLTGCFTLYGNERQYNEGNPYLWGTSGEWARTQRDKAQEKGRQLAYKKMENLTAKGDPVNGLEGTIGNMGNEHLNFFFDGPEKVGEAVPPLTTRKLRLIPGQYRCKVEDAYGNVRGRGSFNVTAQQHTDMAGDKVHFYVYRK